MGGREVEKAAGGPRMGGRTGGPVRDRPERFVVFDGIESDGLLHDGQVARGR
jgi:hypothetical protein